MQLSDRIGRRMKLQDLHVLMTVIQSGSMRKAAQSPDAQVRKAAMDALK